MTHRIEPDPERALIIIKLPARRGGCAGKTQEAWAAFERKVGEAIEVVSIAIKK